MLKIQGNGYQEMWSEYPGISTSGIGNYDILLLYIYKELSYNITHTHTHTHTHTQLGRELGCWWLHFDDKKQLQPVWHSI